MSALSELTVRLNSIGTLELIPIGHFRVHFSLYFKASLSTKPC